jgi:hypothetical protein
MCNNQQNNCSEIEVTDDEFEFILSISCDEEIAIPGTEAFRPPHFSLVQSGSALRPNYPYRKRFQIGAVTYVLMNVFRREAFKDIEIFSMAVNCKQKPAANSSDTF